MKYFGQWHYIPQSHSIPPCRLTEPYKISISFVKTYNLTHGFPGIIFVLLNIRTEDHRHE